MALDTTVARTPMGERIKLGVSACLLGRKVRWDGKDKFDPFLARTFGRYAEFFPFCPEVEAGLPVPREPLRIEVVGDRPRLVGISSGKDKTRQLTRWIKHYISKVAKKEFDGFILKAKSPSCGLKSARRYKKEEGRVLSGAGLLAEALKKALPLTPLEEAETLRKPCGLSSFADKVFVLKRFRALLKERKSKEKIQSFHKREELVIASHCPQKLKILTQILNSDTPTSVCYKLYQNVLLEAMEFKATRAKHFKVLQRIVSSFKADLGAKKLKTLRKKIAFWKASDVPLAHLLKTIRSLAEAYNRKDLLRQSYIGCSPTEFKLRGTL